jgi:hypothetical protein
MYDASSRKDVRKAEKSARIASRDDADAIKKIMSDTFGRAWMWRKLEAAHIFSDPFTGDPLIEAYNKGFRNFGMIFLADIMLHCPNQYLKMTQEANVRRINDDNDSNPASSEHSGGEDANGGNQGRQPTDADDGSEDGTERYNY